MVLQLPEMQNCYFCEIIKRNSDCWNVIEETELTATLLNGRQFATGQCVVIPIRHAPTILNLTELEVGAVMVAAKKLANLMMEAFDPDGILLYQNNGIGSGQEVPHFHLHVVPKCPDSDWGLGPPHIARLENEEQDAYRDHALVTEDKRQTAEMLRTFFKKHNKN